MSATSSLHKAAIRAVRAIHQAIGFSIGEYVRTRQNTVSVGVFNGEACLADLKALRKLTRVCHGCSPVAECPILEGFDREDG